MKTTAVLALLLLSGCVAEKRPVSEGNAQQNHAAELHIDLATAATITGKVAFTGKPPAMPVLDMSANPNCERLNKAPRRAEEVVVNPNHTLRNTLVWIASGLPPGRWHAPGEPARLEQNGCVYEPHVIGLMVGQTLEITNSDTVNHNIHAETAVNPSWNMSEPPRAEHVFRRFSSPEMLFPITCGVHPWMRAYGVVVAHPFFAITGSDGSFTLNGVPPGRYTLQAVHEKYGSRNLEIAIAARQTKDVEFVYRASASN